jgi:Transposase DDE domain group 1
MLRGSVITSNGGLLAYREMDDVLPLTASGGGRLAEPCTGQNRRHLLVGLLRQSVFGRLAGYEDVNDADRLCRDPAMRWVVGGRAPMGRAASASQMGRYVTFQMAEVAVPQKMFQQILSLIARLRAPPAPA